MEQDKIISVKIHGAAYLVGDGRLLTCPVNTDGSFDKSDDMGEMEVDYSPISEKPTHEKVLRELGFPKEKIPQILKHVHYS